MYYPTASSDGFIYDPNGWATDIAKSYGVNQKTMLRQFTQATPGGYNCQGGDWNTTANTHGEIISRPRGINNNPYYVVQTKIYSRSPYPAPSGCMMDSNTIITLHNNSISTPTPYSLAA